MDEDLVTILFMSGFCVVALAIIVGVTVLLVWTRYKKRSNLSPMLEHLPQGGVIDTGRLPRHRGLVYDDKGIHFGYYKVMVHKANKVIIAIIILVTLYFLLSFVMISIEYWYVGVPLSLLLIAGCVLLVRNRLRAGPYYYVCVKCRHVFGRPHSQQGFRLDTGVLSTIISSAHPHNSCPFCNNEDYFRVNVRSKITSRYLENFEDADEDLVDYTG